MSKYNFHSYFLHVLTGATALGETIGTFYNSSDYLNALRSFYPSIILLIIIGDRIKEGIIDHGK